MSRSHEVPRGGRGSGAGSTEPSPSGDLPAGLAPLAGRSGASGDAAANGTEAEHRIRVLEARVRQAEAERDELARACREARDAQLAAERALRADEEILAVVTHDLRNPLGTIVMGVTTLLQPGTLDPQRVRAVAERLQRQAERMTCQVANLGDFAAIRGGRFPIVRVPHEPAAILAELTAVVGPIARERAVAFRAEPAGALPTIACDAERVVQALANLVSNAIKVTPRAGAIDVAVRGDDAAALVFSVHDTGPGLPPDEIAMLFEPTWRSKHADYRGTGLGFAIARGIVEAHGGRIWADSEPGRGTTVVFSLPLAG